MPRRKQGPVQQPVQQDNDLKERHDAVLDQLVVRDEQLKRVLKATHNFFSGAISGRAFSDIVNSVREELRKEGQE